MAAQSSSARLAELLERRVRPLHVRGMVHAVMQLEEPRRTVGLESGVACTQRIGRAAGHRLARRLASVSRDRLACERAEQLPRIEATFSGCKLPCSEDGRPRAPKRGFGMGGHFAAKRLGAAPASKARVECGSKVCTREAPHIARATAGWPGWRARDLQTATSPSNRQPGRHRSAAHRPHRALERSQIREFGGITMYYGIGGTIVLVLVVIFLLRLL